MATVPDYLEWKPYEGPPLNLPRYVFLGMETYLARGVYPGYPRIHTTARCTYECPHCHRQNPRYGPLARHMGLVANVPVACPVLLAADAKRREENLRP